MIKIEAKYNFDQNIIEAVKTKGKDSSVFSEKEFNKLLNRIDQNKWKMK